MVKEEGYVAHFHVGDATVPFDSFTSNGVDSIQIVELVGVRCVGNVHGSGLDGKLQSEQEHF